MKKLIFLLPIFILLQLCLYAQVGIGTATAAASAMLDITSTTQGLLPPRMTYAQKTAIVTPVAGLQIWCSNCGVSGEMQVYNGSIWTNMIGGATSGVFPSVAATVSASTILSTTATSGGNITSDGGAAVTVRGVCWSTSTGPTTALSTKTSNGTGTGIFSSSITGLLPNTTYFVRAYGTNSAGTAYGSEISFTTILAIGDSYMGGIVGYILVSGDPGYNVGTLHGLIVATTIQGSGAGAIPWGCYPTIIPGADGTAIGTGNQNTIDIMAACATAGIPARLCGDLVLGGYSDWYLPSKDELNKLYLNRVAIGGFGSALYWSSSENSDIYAWLQPFSTGIQSVAGKNSYGYSTRAVRSF